MNRSVGEARPQLWTIPSAKDAAYAEMANVVPFHVLPKAPEEVWVANRGASSLELSGNRGRQRDLRPPPDAAPEKDLGPRSLRST